MAADQALPANGYPGNASINYPLVAPPPIPHGKVMREDVIFLAVGKTG
jgi:hypothetical protein